MYIDYMNSPVGTIKIAADETGIRLIRFVDTRDQAVEPNPLIETCKLQLQEYFLGKRKTFNLPFEQNGTPFQQSVWNSLLEIPYGGTASYGDIAKAIKRPRAARAVGAANGKNPLSIIVPCHRVIGSDGTLTGYAGGVTKKAWLLTHEGFKA